MKLFSRFLRLFKVKGSKFIKKHEDSMEIFEYQLEQSKKSLDKLTESQAKMRADLRIVQDKIKKVEEKIPGLKRILDLAWKQKDDALGEEACVEMEKLEKQIEMHRVAEASYQKVLQQLELQYDSLKTKHREKVASLDNLRAKNEFAKNMQLINKELKANYSGDEFDFSSIEKIEQDLNKQMYIEEETNKQLTPEMSLEDRVKMDTRQSRFEEYKAQREAEEQKAIEAPKATIEVMGVAETVKVESK